MPKVETVAATLRELAVSGMSRKDLVAAVRERHPDATKKDVVRAAFYALTAGDAIKALAEHLALIVRHVPPHPYVASPRPECCECS